ncbi:hypothetical protein BJ912DRAFT_1145575 [Pholiota molesta]|nr:hypothetical protein BJ912DRAFT_1145575 [Pholiota molesta]
MRRDLRHLDLADLVGSAYTIEAGGMRGWGAEERNAAVAQVIWGGSVRRQKTVAKDVEADREGELNRLAIAPDRADHCHVPLPAHPPARPPPALAQLPARRRPLPLPRHRTPQLPHAPTGHDLMAMFPPAPPDNFPEMRPGPTSGFFQRQERAFFAQAGKEIVRVRVEVDFPHGAEPEPVKPRPISTLGAASSSSAGRPWMSGPPPGSAHHAHSPSQATLAPVLYPHPPRPARGGGVPPPQPPLYPTHASPVGHSPSLNLHPAVPAGTGLHTPPQDAASGLPLPPPPAPKGGDYPAEEFDDESWRRPMPYAERRRAGKHTRRVIVRT